MSRFDLLTTACLVVGGLGVGPSVDGALPESAPRALRSPSGTDTGEAHALDATATALSDRWAPVFVQHTSAAHPERDRPLRIDFDGDWDTTNDWVNLGTAARHATPAVYASAILTDTHAFLTYTLFYPRDWALPLCVPYVCHDNDLEVVLLVVERERANEAAGLVLVETKTHNSYLATPGPKVLREAGARPLIEIESQGHGMTAMQTGALPESDSRWYTPAHAEEIADRDVSPERYELWSLHDTLWARRHAVAERGRLWIEGESGFLFYSGQRTGRVGEPLGASMAGSVFPGGVRPPWALRSYGQRGDWFLDPAFVVRGRYRSLLPADRVVSAEYTYNPFLDDLNVECAARGCPAAPPARASVTLSPLALAIFALLALASRWPRRRAV